MDSLDQGSRPQSGVTTRGTDTWCSNRTFCPSSQFQADQKTCDVHKEAARKGAASSATARSSKQKMVRCLEAARS